MPSHPFYMMDGRVSGCIVTLLWLLILSHPHRVFGSEIFPKVPDNVTVLEGSRLSIEWHVTPSLKHKDILWCYFRRRPNELVSWTKFVGWNPHSRRLNISTIGHVGWEFLTPEPCISGIKRQNVTPDYSGIYDLTLKDNQQREDEQVTYVTVIQDVDLEYAVFIDGKIYTGTARRTPELPGDIELKQDKSLLVNVSAPWASAITISRDDHSDIEHCEDRPCAVQLNASESGKTQSQFIIRIESTIQGAESIELKLNATVQPVHAEPAASSYMLLAILLGVLFGLAVVVAIGNLLYAQKFRGDPKGEKANRRRLEEEVQKLELENEDLKNAKDKLEADKVKLTTENTGLKSDLTKEEEEVKELKTNISEQNQSHLGEVHVLRLQLSEKDKDIRKMARDIEEMKTLKTDLMEEKKTNTALAKANNGLTLDLELLHTTNSSLQNQVNEQDKKTKQKPKDAATIKQLQERNKQLEGETDKLKQEKKQLQERNKQLEGEADKLKQEKDGEINRLKMTLQTSDTSQTKADDDTTSIMSMESTPGKQVKKKKMDELVKKASECLHKLETKHIPNWERLESTYGTADTKIKSQALLQEIIDLRASINTKRAYFSLASDERNEMSRSYSALGYTKPDVEKLISHIEENESKPLYARRKEIKPTLDTLYGYKSSLSDILSQYEEKTVNDEDAFRRLTDAVKTVEDDKDKGDKFSKADSALSKQVMLKANVKEFRDQLDKYTHLVESQQSNCAPYLVEPEIGAVGDKRSAAKAGPPVRNATPV